MWVWTVDREGQRSAERMVGGPRCRARREPGCKTGVHNQGPDDLVRTRPTRAAAGVALENCRMLFDKNKNLKHGDELAILWGWRADVAATQTPATSDDLVETQEAVEAEHKAG